MSIALICMSPQVGQVLVQGVSPPVESCTIGTGGESIVLMGITGLEMG